MGQGIVIDGAGSVGTVGEQRFQVCVLAFRDWTVACDTPKLKQNNEAWLSLVERCVRDAEVAGSNPVASTKALRIPWLRDSFFAYKEIQNVIFQRIFCAWLV